jgi:hypothetical protein
MTAVTINGEIQRTGGVDLSSFSTSLLSSEIVLRSAGTWKVSIFESGASVPSHLSGSPFQVEILPADTSPMTCKTYHTASIVSGQSWSLRVETFDEYSNPTNSESDEFVGWFDESEAGTKKRGVVKIDSFIYYIPGTSVVCPKSSH